MEAFSRALSILYKVLAIAFVIVIVAGCASEAIAAQDEEEPEPRSYYLSNHDRMCILIDDETNVNYIYYGTCGGITPRLNADGSLYISE